MRITLQSVGYDYPGTDQSAPVHVLDDVSLSIESGDFAVLMGPSGSGKSTLLNLLGAVDQPSRGLLTLGDQETSRLNENDLTMLRRKSIGFVFQFFNLVPTLTVFENVAFPLSLAGRPRAEVAERVNEALTRIGIAHRARHYPAELSGGEMQRAAIGRAIVHEPPLILADEPTGNLDSASGTAILELLREIHQSLRPTIVMATHSDRAASYGDYVIRIEDGRVSR